MLELGLTAQFHFWEYLFRILNILSLRCSYVIVDFGETFLETAPSMSGKSSWDQSTNIVHPRCHLWKKSNLGENQAKFNNAYILFIVPNRITVSYCVHCVLYLNVRAARWELAAAQLSCTLYKVPECLDNWCRRPQRTGPTWLPAQLIWRRVARRVRFLLCWVKAGSWSAVVSTVFRS